MKGQLKRSHLRFEGDNFLLDLQVVRAAVKAYKKVAAARGHVALSPSTAYLHLVTNADQPMPTQQAWQDTHSCTLLLEQRALALVQDRATHENDADASADQRVSRAVTEAFVAEQIETFIKTLYTDIGGSGKEAAVVRDLLHLVRPFKR